MPGMGEAKRLIVSAGAATTAVGVRVARTLYARWRTLGPAQRERIAPLAEDAKERALELRGQADVPAAERELAYANETLAAAIVETAEADPELDELEVRNLREDLRRELDRLASADVRASRGPGTASAG
jgi:hypothetical protein